MKRCEHGRYLERCHPCRAAAGMARQGVPLRVGSFPRDQLRPGVASSHVGKTGAVVHAVGISDADVGTGQRICTGGPSTVLEGSLVLVTCKACRSKAKLS